MTRGLQEDCGNDDILRTVRGSSSRNLSITRRGSHLFLKIKFNGVLTHYVFHKKRLKLFYMLSNKPYQSIPLHAWFLKLIATFNVYVC